jgi:hypothetical protein
MNRRFYLVTVLLIVSICMPGCGDPAEPVITKTAATRTPTAAVNMSTPAPVNSPTVQKTAPATSPAPTGPVSELADKPYVDPNGYFKVTPPRGWNIETYPSEPRGKVAFGKTEGDQLVEIRVLVQVTQVTDFQEFVSRLKSNASNLGWKPEWQLLTFSGLSAVKSTMTVTASGLTRKITNLRFLDGNIYHDIQFSSLPALFDKYQDVMSKVLATYELVKRPN